ncbi:permease-like cell division protein FtsX [Phytohabitans sp. ZYX-F-186]|uniref:Permease-like cell division protein FtsX n=1 Tax=Phytohabitans maris TaxID=3071409 RepID=A0ABU0ZKD1_9ACTN|nr:permease-like cell division protein FtsX [Phytohabitans sp. ZYX-F-186]MDQ7907498.1 permease-like cell division protein FtsX [Phytohabitans sp. ZYX-F-186]
MLPAVVVAAMLCGAGAATAVTLLVVRDEQPQSTREYEVRVILDVDLPAEQKAAVESALSSRYPADTIGLETREEAYQRFKETYKDDPDLVESVRPESLPESFVVTTTVEAFDCAALSPVERMDGVEAIRVWQPAAAGRPCAVLLDCP